MPSCATSIAGHVGGVSVNEALGGVGASGMGHYHAREGYNTFSKLRPAIIAILGTHFPLSAKALGELTGMDQVSISRAVQQLAGKKLVSRRVDLADLRRVVLRLSKKGEEV